MNRSADCITDRCIKEGVNRIILQTGDADRVIVRSKDCVVSPDRTRGDTIPGKGAISNETTCNVFDLLKICGVPLAYERRHDQTQFVARRCKIIPLRVFVSRFATASYIERRPNAKKLEKFDPLEVEFFLETSGQVWKGHLLPIPDPFILIKGGQACFFEPNRVLAKQKPFLNIPSNEILDGPDYAIIEKIETWSRKVFTILEKAYRMSANFTLVCMNIQFGVDSDGKLLVTDVIDAESVQIMRDGIEFDKQPYHGNEPNPFFMDRWQAVCVATARFGSI